MFGLAVLGPPRVSATGHGDRLLLNVTLPSGRADESIEKTYHKVSFSIFWKKAGESKEHKETTTQSEHVINNLHQGVEYCVMVQPEIIENPNLLSSDWTCRFTSPLPLNPADISGAVVRPDCGCHSARPGLGDARHRRCGRWWGR
ncbi:interferon alpha/beta receptor 2-like [Conger conger]|uniref:interferon alpha/beta receptor 2-like n=1 Tax=Conger conger TaxID=82655 RepID=UPI002A5A805E|nr:interferon alpha/beta receptor 2-like [Conger conger]